MIWVAGSRGMLGEEVCRRLEAAGLAFAGTDREVDITDPGAVGDFAGQAPEPFEWIVNCAAYTAVDRAEEEGAACRRLNAAGPGNLAAWARSAGAAMIHISTDYVFDGKGIRDPGTGELRPYREEDPANPAGVYGRTKREGERAALENNPRSYVVRTAWLYGKHGKNFVNTMLRLMNGSGAVKVVSDQRGSPTWAGDLAGAISALIGAAAVPPGIYHYTNEGVTSWYGFAEAVYRQGRERGLIAGECEVKPCTSGEYPAKAARPAWSALDKTKIKRALGIRIPAWEASLGAYLDSLRGEGGAGEGV